MASAGGGSSELVQPCRAAQVLSFRGVSAARRGASSARRPSESALSVRYIAGHGWNEDQSIERWNVSLGSKVLLKVKANSVGPWASRWAMRFLASSIPGRWPAGTHQSAM